MGVRESVFLSPEERGAFVHLARNLRGDHRIYHNLPFLNVFTTDDLRDWSTLAATPVVVGPGELADLRSATIDFTLCDEFDKPIVCIDFDAMGGFNVGDRYEGAPACAWL